MKEHPPILEFQGIHAGYGGRSVLQDVSVTIRPGEQVALIGPNGCGKSTLFRVAAGILPADSGAVHIAGHEATRWSADARIRSGLGYLMQTRNIFADLTVDGNLALAAESLSGNGFDARALKILEALPALQSCRSKRAGLLSGGQRQALAVAMVLMRPPTVLLLDEPVAGLSPPAATALLKGLARLANSEGFASVIVEHRLRQVQPFVNRVLVMREGRIVDDTCDTERMLDTDWLTGHYMNRKA